MRTYALVLAAVLAVSLLAAPGQDIPGTDLQYQGPGTVSVTSDPAQVEALMTNAPYGGLSPVPAGLVVISISGVTPGGAVKIKAKGKSSSDMIAVFIYGDAGLVQIDCGQSDGHGELHYLYAGGAVKKVLLKGLLYAGKLVIDNAGSASGVQVMNVSKTKASKSPGGGTPSGNIHSVITSGKLSKLHSNHGLIGGASADNPGVIAVGTDSPDGQVKPKAGLAFVLICKALTSSNAYAYAQAYNECIASNAVLPYVTSAKLKQLNTKAIGPAVCAVELGKKCSAKKTTVTEPLVGRENVLQ